MTRDPNPAPRLIPLGSARRQTRASDLDGMFEPVPVNRWPQVG